MITSSQYDCTVSKGKCGVRVVFSFCHTSKVVNCMFSEGRLSRQLALWWKYGKCMKTPNKSHQSPTQRVSRRLRKDQGGGGCLWTVAVTISLHIQRPLIMWPKLHTKVTRWQTQPSPWQLSNSFCQTTVSNVKNEPSSSTMGYTTSYPFLRWLCNTCPGIIVEKQPFFVNWLLYSSVS